MARRAAIIGLLLALSPAHAVAEPVLALKPGETLLEVEAEGVARATPDVATFTLAVAADGATPAAALRANADRTARLVAAARGAGIVATDMKTTGLSVSPRYRQERGEDTDDVVGYRSTSRLQVRVTAMARASATLAALVDAGATEVSGPDFSFADDAAQRRAARKDAVAAATAQAADYAAALNRRVVRILRVSERRRWGGESADIVVTGSRQRPTGNVPIEPGEQETHVTVWIDYAMAE
jgi:uncharacterized protein YggE